MRRWGRGQGVHAGCVRAGVCVCVYGGGGMCAGLIRAERALCCWPGGKEPLTLTSNTSRTVPSVVVVTAAVRIWGAKKRRAGAGRTRQAQARRQARAGQCTVAACTARRADGAGRHWW